VSTEVPEPPPSSNTNQRWIIAVVVAVALLAGAVVAVLLLQDDDGGGSGDTAAAETTAVNASVPTPEQVSTAQAALAAVGCYTGPVDGIYGPETDAAIRAYQSAKGLAVDGYLGPQTQEALQESVAAGETVCGADDTEGSGDSAPTPTVALVTSDGLSRTFDVVTCSSSDETSFELTAQSESAQLTASATAGQGPIVLVEGSGQSEGTVEAVQVGDSGELAASGSLTPADDSAASATFELSGSCITP
jgi:peptidoglycan hydrolase-like protein with peptidoglycan-binding domain